MLPPQCDSNDVIDADVASTNASSATSTSTNTNTTITNRDHTAAASTMCKIPPTLDVGEDNNNCYELDVINSKDPYAELERYLEKVKVREEFDNAHIDKLAANRNETPGYCVEGGIMRRWY